MLGINEICFSELLLAIADSLKLNKSLTQINLKGTILGLIYRYHNFFWLYGDRFFISIPFLVYFLITPKFSEISFVLHQALNISSWFKIVTSATLFAPFNQPWLLLIHWKLTKLWLTLIFLIFVVCILIFLALNLFFWSFFYFIKFGYTLIKIWNFSPIFLLLEFSLMFRFSIWRIHGSCWIIKIESILDLY